MIYGDGPYADALRYVLADRANGLHWVAEHVATNEDGSVNADPTLKYIHEICSGLPRMSVVVLSSQLPVGTCAVFEDRYPGLLFVVQPENVRAATAVQDFLNQDRFVVGTRHDFLRGMFRELLPAPCLFMSPESAEMSKHAMNVYLALCVRYGNELGRLCELWGPDATMVVRALRSEARVADTAPLLPGDPPSMHLMREVHTMLALGGGDLIRALV